MNRKIIQKILKQKYEEWLESIEDSSVKELCKKNGIITGGSIVSILLGENVKDYDVYFRDKNTVSAVAQYYINRFNAMHPDKPHLPELIFFDDNPRVKISVKSAGVVSEEAINNDWFDKEMQRNPIEHPEPDESEKDKPKYRPVFMSANAITLSNKVQLVIRFYGDPAEIHKNYDYVHCCNYWESGTGELTLNPSALESILTKNLYYQGSLYPVCSVIRMRKFLKQGWYINAGQILKMLFQVSALDLTDIDTLEEQLTGVDAMYFHQVIDYCKERKEKEPDFNITAPYLISIIDKIFG